MKPTWALVTAPTTEPISLTEAKQFARITHTQDDPTLTRFVATAREEAERVMNRGVYTQTWQYKLGRFYDVMYLPMAAPLQNDANASPPTAPIVQYYDPAGVLQTLATSVYTVDTVSRPGRLVRAPAQAWPSVQADRLDGTVTITYVVGWATVDAIPERIKQGCRQYVTYLDCDREGLEAYGLQALQAAERCWSDVVMWIPPDDGYARRA